MKREEIRTTEYVLRRIRICTSKNSKEAPHHLVEGGIPGLPGDLGLAFGGFVWIRQQVSLDIGVGVRSVLGHLQVGVWGVGWGECVDQPPQTSQQENKVLTRSLMCMTMMKRVPFL